MKESLWVSLDQLLLDVWQVLMKGGGMGFVMNLVLGLFGGVLGGWLFDQLGITWGGILGQLGTAIVGAVAILWVASLIKK